MEMEMEVGGSGSGSGSGRTARGTTTRPTVIGGGGSGLRGWRGELGGVVGLAGRWNVTATVQLEVAAAGCGRRGLSCGEQRGGGVEVDDGYAGLAGERQRPQQQGDDEGGWWSAGGWHRLGGLPNDEEEEEEEDDEQGGRGVCLHKEEEEKR
ncbi:uncharacterized protein LOC115728049 [Rhodamnia argentea]|uniref:Uncharacterized protein LOC115728049 n=1 Tax=Rhodamnia argentea TaxID=178133 RepID=A0A8B8MW68_9MYRT|nr:uncharacterized protein LOC115728049 [Rhodamnia argentea]